MEWLPIAGAFVGGLVLGLLLAFALRLVQARTGKQLAEEFLRENESHFARLSFDALSRSSDYLIRLAKQELGAQSRDNAREFDEKRKLIDQQLGFMNSELGRVSELIRALGEDRARQFGELTSRLASTGEEIARLTATTASLQQALAGNQARGQWGERIAEDILRLAGFVEGINYWKQAPVVGERTRPDFTFLLPRDLILNMDVKFPFDNYLRFLESGSDADRESHRRRFLADVRDRVKEVASRGYINPDQNTVDCALMFIPNEQVYRFIHEQDSAIIETALEQRVVVCSPLTLFVVLAIIRQAAENFAIEQSSREILALLGRFNKQWEQFVGKMDEMDTQIEKLREVYDSLLTTRRRQLEKPLKEIESRRAQYGIPIAGGEEEGPGIRGRGSGIGDQGSGDE